jgi:two-component system, NtrC family, nitrogen regulation sensor histidine kinase NtrY
VASLVHSARLIAKSPEHLHKLEQVFDTIEERARHLTAFLNAYAQFARLPKPRPSSVAWEPFLKRLGALYPEAKISEPPTASAWFDAAQVEQLLINLLKNAGESGGAAAAVELTVQPEAEGVTLEISDRGLGLSQEALESAFLPLYSTKERGSGLGLALCREIVEAHGGNVSIKNRDGGGCTVTCWIPGMKQPGSDVQASRARLTLTRA